MPEPQYADYKTLPRMTLGTMSNEVWLRDPKMLGIHLARYKFVAKMLKGKERVAEVGCGDGFYSRLVREEVGMLHLYDFDPGFAKEANGVCHDITQASLHWGFARQQYDAIYSLDVAEHIAPMQSELYLENIAKSLTPNGVFICGMPSLESQAYASPASKAGHVNCMPGEDFRTWLQGHFHNVFLFGMHDETISTAFLPMCHYLLGVCCAPR